MPCNEGLISRYEELRQQALERPHGMAHGQGLALLMRSGMSGWIQAWAQRVVEVPVLPQKSLSDEAIFPCAMHREVTMILAGMVLQGRQEASA